MPALLSVYPDALFVQTHRTPVDAMASVSSLVTILRNAFSDAVDPLVVSREAVDYWSETTDKFLRERDRFPNNRICDIQYDEIRGEPVGAVRRIYEHFGWTLSRDAEQRIRALVASQAERQSANHRYDLSQFGFSAEEVLSKFKTYCQRFGLELSSGVPQKKTERTVA
jgi:hypothetical protein